MGIDGMAILSITEASIQEIIRNKYTQSFLTLALFFVFAKLAAWVAERFILKLAAKTKTEVDDIIVKKTRTPMSILLFVLGIKLAVVPLNLEAATSAMANHIISTLAVLLLSYVVVVILDILLEAGIKRKALKTGAEADENLILISTKTSRVVFFIIAALFILRIWDIQIGPLLASLGIIGVAVAFGLQNTLGNIFGGVSLLLDRSIKVGDVVKIDEETSGTVIDVGLRSTRIKTWNNEVVIIPNGKLAGVNIKNYVLPNSEARIEVLFSVAYGSDVDKVKKVVMGEIKKLDNLSKSHDPSVMFIEMGASSLNFKCLVWIKSYKERFATKEKLNCLIYNSFSKNKISIPFPQMDVYVKQFENQQKKKIPVRNISGSTKKMKKTGENLEN
ncbi:MAG: mechanosensitive ion channel family protein [Nanoarchaeota archaeon]|nr:mechanosensitive ion channel family protein [Nanoarchaeota archaeon]MBU1005022.1 mechanosensitive ion channel family protein [Nanoarchaeota archaeon]MBU1945914.1 mechanosensitive ion channel family protein [Nanoarchaeota archaeon]